MFNTTSIDVIINTDDYSDYVHYTVSDIDYNDISKDNTEYPELMRYKTNMIDK